MYKIKNKVTYFGLEFDHNPIPNAIVIVSARPQKIIKWVNSYKPVVYTREDGKEVRRERTAVQCPIGFRLNKDEVKAAMKRNKTESYQDGKFFVVLDHRMGQFEHPDTVKMKKDELRKKVSDAKRESSEAARKKLTPGDLGEQLDTISPQVPVGIREGIKPPVSVPDSANPDHGSVESTTETGLKVTDRRRGTVANPGEEPVV